jgi:hypothetical protein
MTALSHSGSLPRLVDRDDRQAPDSSAHPNRCPARPRDKQRSTHISTTCYVHDQVGIVGNRRIVSTRHALILFARVRRRLWGRVNEALRKQTAAEPAEIQIPAAIAEAFDDAA